MSSEKMEEEAMQTSEDATKEVNGQNRRETTLQKKWEGWAPEFSIESDEEDEEEECKTFLDPRTGEEINIMDPKWNHNYDDDYKEPEDTGNNLSLQAQLRMVRPVPCGNRMIEYYFAMNYGNAGSVSDVRQWKAMANARQRNAESKDSEPNFHRSRGRGRASFFMRD